MGGEGGDCESVTLTVVMFKTHHDSYTVHRILQGTVTITVDAVVMCTDHRILRMLHVVVMSSVCFFFFFSGLLAFLSSSKQGVKGLRGFPLNPINPEAPNLHKPK